MIFNKIIFLKNLYLIVLTGNLFYYCVLMIIISGKILFDGALFTR